MNRTNLPNILTLLRVPLAVAFFVFFAVGEGSAPLTFASFGFLLVGGLTDAADGYLARKWNAESGFGRIADPLMDKILICGGFIILLPTPYVAHWMVIVVVVRELLVTALRAQVEAGGVKFGAKLWGKAKMIVQWAAMLVVVWVMAMAYATDGQMPGYPHVAVWLAVVVTILSAVGYVVSARHVLSKQWSAGT